MEALARQRRHYSDLSGGQKRRDSLDAALLNLPLG
jgi:energy-coupling factor transporter ATP-binding protein EcfA2